MSDYADIPPTPPRFSASFDAHTLAEIRRAAATGIYDIRGGGAKRDLPHFDDLVFLGASISRYPLVSGGNRPALGVSESRLDRPRRPGDQDRGAAGDHRLGEADLREGRCQPLLL